MDLSIIVVTYNSEQFIRKCLNSLVVNLPQRYLSQVVVVDNASTDRSVNIITQEFPTVHLIRSARNIGFGQGNNLGMRKFPACFYYLHNADAYLQENVLDRALDMINADHSIGIAGLPLVFPDFSAQTAAYSHSTPLKWILQATALPKVAQYIAPNPRCGKLRTLLMRIPMAHSYIATHSGNIGQANHSLPVEYDWVCGAAMILSEEVRQALKGGFDPAIFLYGEDEDLCICAKQSNFRVVQLPVRPVIHEFGWGNTRKTSPEIIQLKVKSLKVFINKHFSKNRPSWVAMRTLLFLKSLYWRLF